VKFVEEVRAIDISVSEGWKIKQKNVGKGEVEVFPVPMGKGRIKLCQKSLVSL
jgi:hypothetical protein